MKPVCEAVLTNPSLNNIARFVDEISKLKTEIIQELQQYLLLPFVTHIRYKAIMKQYELQRALIDAMTLVLEKITLTNYEISMFIVAALLCHVFDKSMPEMIADIPEELKLSVMRCITTLMLHISDSVRLEILESQTHAIVPIIFVAVHMAKLERLRPLRLAAINTVKALTSTHEDLTNDSYHISKPKCEALVLNLLASTLPGVLAALQDVATCKENPGHAVIVAAVNTIHRILCITLHDKHLTEKSDVTAKDFAQMISDKLKCTDTDTQCIDMKDVTMRTERWYTMAGEKVTIVIQSLISLRTHYHVKVRKELAVLCSRVLMECNQTMRKSVPLVLDVLITLSNDDYPEVSEYCKQSINTYFAEASEERKLDAVDSLHQNLLAALTSLPRILNGVDSSNRLSALNRIHGYVRVLSAGRPQRLTDVTSRGVLTLLCDALLAAAEVRTDLSMLTTHPTADLTAPPPTEAPWCNLRNLCDMESERCLQDICRLLGEAECGELVVDHLLNLMTRDCEVVYLMNWMASAPKAPPSLAKRILDTYLEDDLWYAPLEVESKEAPISEEETLDVTVYNPRAWEKDNVPGLYEGATEVRYTDMSYRVPYSRGRDSVTPALAHRNLALSCLLTDALGMMASKLRDHFQPYLLKSLCRVLERVGSKYEMLHLAGLKALHAMAEGCGHTGVGDLIAGNADYLTSQITNRLRKPWNIKSALEILSVVMEYSDTDKSLFVWILDNLYGIVEDVLVQSCDKYHENDLYAYLQVFLTFIDRIRKAFPVDNAESTKENINKHTHVLKDVLEYAKHTEESERLLNSMEFEEESGKSVEEMYREDMKNKEENVLDYDDRVTSENQPPPRHITVTVSILKRCVHFIMSKRRDDAILALHVMSAGLPVLSGTEDQLLPLVHLTWAPLSVRIRAESAIARAALDVLVTMATLAKDFIRSRASKEVLPYIYQCLHKSAQASLLKDKGAAYRLSAAYRLQEAALSALPNLAVNLRLDEEGLEQAMNCVDPYLSCKQPKPLQERAVAFFKHIMAYNYGAAWCHLRKLCNNEEVLAPPAAKYIKLEAVVGTPYEAADKHYDINVKRIFDRMPIDK